MGERVPVYLCSSEDRRSGITAILERLLGERRAGGKVVIKANFNSADPFPASTHPDALEAAIRFLQDPEPHSLTLVERSGMGDTLEVLEAAGVTALAKEMGFGIEALDRAPPPRFVQIRRGDLHWRNGFWISRSAREADLLLNLCCLKTHRFGGHFTLSLKNAVGLVARRVEGDPHDYMQELHSSPHQRRMIAEINAFYRADAVIIDADQGFVRGGPERGEIAKPGLLIGSRDRVAADAAGVALLRLFGTTREVERGRVFEQEQLVRAGELGVGIRSSGGMELVPLDPVSRPLAEQLTVLLSREG